MNQFSIEDFAAECKGAMQAAGEVSDRKDAARKCLEAAMKRCGAEGITAALEAAVPDGANIGELIVHTSPELTMLYGRLPARFQSGIHNHTVTAVIGQLAGDEANVFYDKDDDGTLREVRRAVIHPGEVLTLDADAIHSIENPGTDQARALHLYGGDFGAIMGQRSLWSWDEHEEKPFSFPELVRESVAAMHHSDNREGLEAMAEAIPASKALIDSL